MCRILAPYSQQTSFLLFLVRCHIGAQVPNGASFPAWKNIEIRHQWIVVEGPPYTSSHLPVSSFMYTLESLIYIDYLFVSYWEKKRDRQCPYHFHFFSTNWHSIDVHHPIQSHQSHGGENAFQFGQESCSSESEWKATLCHKTIKHYGNFQRKYIFNIIYLLFIYNYLFMNISRSNLSCLTKRQRLHWEFTMFAC